MMRRKVITNSTKFGDMADGPSPGDDIVEEPSQCIDIVEASILVEGVVEYCIVQLYIK